MIFLEVKTLSTTLVVTFIGLLIGTVSFGRRIETGELEEITFSPKVIVNAKYNALTAIAAYCFSLKNIYFCEICG